MDYGRAIGSGFDPRRMPPQGLALDATHPIARGLLGFWLLAGGAVRDLSRNNYNGTMVGAPGLGSGLLGPAVNLVSASTQYVDIPDPGSTLTAPAMSYVAWIKPASLPNSYNAIVHKGNGANYFEYFVTGAGKIAIYTPNSSYDGSGSHTLSAGTTYCVAATFDSNTVGVTGYVNGQFDNVGNLPGTALTLGGPSLSIGRDSVTAGRNFDGFIGPVGVWNRALTAAEVATLYSEPYTLLRPVVRRTYYAVAAVGGNTYSGSLADSIATSDAVSSVLVAHGTLSDTVATSDAVAGAMAALASLSDTLATSDTLTGAIRITAALSDTAAASESLTSVLSATGVLADTAATSDAVLIFGGAAYSGTLADTAATSDSLTGAVRVTAALSDTAATSDAVIATVSLSGALADSVATSEAWASVGQFHGALADTVASSDLLQRFGANAYTASLTDAVGTSDAFFSRMAAHASWADTTATAGTFRAAAAPLGPATTIIPGPLIRPPLNDPPMRGAQFSQAWSGFFQNIAGQVAATAKVTTSATNLATSPSYANDAAAAAGGVAVGGLYRNGSVVCVRLV